mmetsp:Transcript_9696/g.14105  ORF Transcript_9696/g.14105 Transcript_9696/m.14105 type:complete len:435 (+) Transcript_9696:73-1377(+)
MNNINPTIAKNNNNSEEEACIFRSCLLQSNFNHSMHFSKHEKDKRKHCTVPCSDKRNSNKAEKPAGKTMAWEIGSIDSLPNAANIFPLERTRVSLDSSDDSSPNEIGERIIRCLGDLSISVISTKGNKLLAQSIARDIRFYVKLYKEQSDHDDRYRVMVELQRRRGCSLSFIKVARTILHAAKHGHFNQKEENTKPAFSSQSEKRTVDVDGFHDNKEEETSSCFSSDLRYTLDLIMDDRMDLRLLGMQDLVFYTNSEHMNCANALRVASLVLQNHNDSGNSNDWSLGVDDFIQRFISFNNMFEDSNNEWNDDSRQWYLSKTRHCALTVLANSLHVVCSSTTDGGLVPSQLMTCTDTLLQILFHELNDTEKRPQDAYQAMRCMKVLFKVLPPEVLQKASELGAKSAVNSSLSTECYYRALLANESAAAVLMECVI